MGSCGDGEGGGAVNVKLWTFTGGGVAKIEQVQTRGDGRFKFLSFCESVIIECSLYIENVSELINNASVSIIFLSVRKILLSIELHEKYYW